MTIHPDLDGLWQALEAELRRFGHLSFATCEALRADPRLAGLESCLVLLRCTLVGRAPVTASFERPDRIHVCRLLLLSIGAHSVAPWCSRPQLEQLVEAALSIPGAELDDVVNALFALLGEVRGPVSDEQAHLVRELAAQMTRKRRLHGAEGLVWIAVRLADPAFEAIPAQGLLAVQGLPPSMLRPIEGRLLALFRSSPHAAEVERALK